MGRAEARRDADGRGTCARFCEGRIAHYKIPRYVKVVDGFPLTVTGKVQKYLMREQMKRERRGDLRLAPRRSPVSR